ncbi:metallopeptidase [uncultured Gimesia sp.]|uniref:metallopeptidase n=1 Tax=uncultured Gimesia sp. TaxID=1678688 RepID=UPI0026029C29|nr:metallopeptidase [uncultured Gimesia sp.]
MLNYRRESRLLFRRLPYLLLACLFISNSSRLRAEDVPQFYDPIEKHIEGWTIAVDPLMLTEEHAETGQKALDALANHLQRVKYIVSEERVAELQKLRIWVEWDNKMLNTMAYHPSKAWLKAHGHDPRLAKHIHISSVKKLLDRKMWAKHPYCVLHELAHAYHDQVLSFDQAEIVAAYQDAKKKGIYEKVLVHTGKQARHYGLNNHKEYFAEATEAYFGVNDFYPFVRAELKAHDPGMYALLIKIWGPIS